MLYEVFGRTLSVPRVGRHRSSPLLRTGGRRGWVLSYRAAADQGPSTDRLRQCAKNIATSTELSSPLTPASMTPSDDGCRPLTLARWAPATRAGRSADHR